MYLALSLGIGITMESEMQLPLPNLPTCTVAVIGLGYVGLPLAVEFAKVQLCVRTGETLRRRIIGFDVNTQRLDELGKGVDRTNETSAKDLRDVKNFELTSDPAALAVADVFIVTVPTPIDSAKRPDLTPLQKASETVGLALKARSSAGATSIPVVIYESTVYPGATEEVCVPILEDASDLRFNQGFVCGYSPERINPGDHEHRLTTITKVTSGSSHEAAVWVDFLYSSIITAGTFRAASLKVAEAAKVIENTQRDLNIALVNELAIIFREMNLDTLDVLEAAGTKWNFQPFRPGLVGGHCIGVDPYYLTHKAEQLGYHPQVVLAGRRINDSMSRWVVENLVLELARRGAVIAGARVLVLGLTFKQNCPDLRNTCVVDLLKSLDKYSMKYDVVDPWVDPAEAYAEYDLKVRSELSIGQKYDAVILAVSHDQFLDIDAESWKEMLVSPSGVLMDLKGIIPRELEPVRL